MQKTVSTLLNGIIDYAGLFPPAKLSLYDAIHEFRRYRDHKNANLLARFVVPIAQLTNVHQEVGEFINVTKSPWVFTVLLNAQQDADSFLESLETDVKAMRKFLDRYRQGEAVVDSCEVVLPQEFVDNPSAQDLVPFLSEVKEILSEMPGVPRLFFEVPYRQTKLLEKISTAFAQHNKHERHNIAVKLRTGGLTPETVPTPEQVALALVTLKENGLAFKATAGLHQPLRHFDKDVGVDVFGFFNIWFAAAAIYTQPANVGQLVEILQATKSSFFQFASEIAAAGNFRFTLADLAKTRSEFALSFGSCSFAEPIDCLKNLELLS